MAEVRPLAGGFSHETCLLTLNGGERVVVRLGGPDPGTEAAVMARARAHVPVPRVLCLVPRVNEETRPAMVLEYVTGTSLGDVLATAANSLVVRRHNIDQVLIFGAVMMALIMIAVQAVLIGV